MPAKKTTSRKKTTKTSNSRKKNNNKKINKRGTKKKVDKVEKVTLDVEPIADNGVVSDIESKNSEASAVNPDDVKLKKVGGKYVIDRGNNSISQNTNQSNKEDVNQNINSRQPISDQQIQQQEASAMGSSSNITASEEIVPLEKKNMKLWAIGVVIFIFVISITGILLYLRYQLPPKLEEEQSVEIVEEPVDESEYAVEEAMDISQLSRGEITLDILNASGIAGLAGDTASEFEDLGYTIHEIGNSTRIENNEVYVNRELEGELDKLMGDLEERLNISTISGYIEENESTASARIILGE